MNKILFITFALAGLLWASRAHVELNSSAEVGVGRIHLGDIASIEGDSALVNRLQDLEVGRIELPGRETRISVNALKTFYLRSICPLESLTVEGEGSVAVRSLSQTLDRDSLLQLLVESVGPRMTGIQGKDWELEAPRLPDGIKVPQGEYSAQIELPARFDGRGDETATLRVSAQGKSLLTYTLPFVVRRYGYVVRSVVPIHRGEPVKAAQVALERVELTHQPRPMISNLNDAIGRSAVRTIGRGVDLVDSWLERPFVVHEGEQVRLQVQLGTAMISAMGVARQGGYLGQRIEVENLDTHKKLQGLVNGTGEVLIQD